jgi:hypothetical protein
VALAAAAGSVLIAGSSHAAHDAADCDAINNGAFDIELGAETAATRRAVLQAGERLTFRFEAATAGPFGALTLREGAGAPRSLLVGPAGTSVSFAAPKKGTFDFEFSKDGATDAAFQVTCAPAARGRQRTRAAGARRSVPPLGGTFEGASNLETGQLAGVILDVGIPAPGPARAPAWMDRSEAEPAGTPAPGGALDMRMQWKGERYAPGPDGLQIDHTASGVDAALNYKPLPEIMIGALAQIDQPGTTLAGPPLALSDQGWMAGPVTTLKLAPGLSLDARAAWGIAENVTDPLAGHAAGTSRRTISAKLANTQSFGSWRVTPSISLNHFHGEALPAPAAEAVGTAGPASASFGRVDVGPEFAYRIDLGKETFVEPRAVIGSFWDIDSLSSLAPGSESHGAIRLKAEAGLTIGMDDGAKLQAGGAVEEGALGAPDVWSGRLQLSVPMR